MMNFDIPLYIEEFYVISICIATLCALWKINDNLLSVRPPMWLKWSREFIFILAGYTNNIISEDFAIHDKYGAILDPKKAYAAVTRTILVLKVIIVIFSVVYILIR